MKARRSVGYWFLGMCLIGSVAGSGRAEPANRVTRIRVTPSQIVALGVDRKIGICLNFTLDRNDASLREGLRKLGVSAVRFQEGEFGDNWHFDRANPTKPLLGVADPKVWYHDSKTDGQRWKSTLTPAGFLDVVATQNLEAYSIVGIDALVYDGSSPHSSRAEIITSAGDFVGFARETANRLKRSTPIVQNWEIGNENDLQGMLGKVKLGHSWDAFQYAQVAAELAVHIKRADPRVRIGVNGMTPKSTWWRDVLTCEVEVDGQAMRLSDLIDFLVTHQYSWVGNYTQWRDAGPDWEYARNVTVAVEAAKQFAPGKPVAVTEWSAYSPGTLKKGDRRNNAWHAVHNLQMLGEILKCNPVTHACFWVTQWSSDAGLLHNALTPEGTLTPVGESLRFWSEFAESDLVEANHAGKICVYATSNGESGRLVIFLLNRSDRTQFVELDIAAEKEMRIASMEHLCAAGDDPLAESVERRSSSRPSRVDLARLTLPPVSATAVILLRK